MLRNLDQRCQTGRLGALVRIAPEGTTEMDLVESAIHSMKRPIEYLFLSEKPVPAQAFRLLSESTAPSFLIPVPVGAQPDLSAEFARGESTVRPPPET